MNIKMVGIGINLRCSWKPKKFVDEGKIREIGLSNETPWGVSKFLEISKEKNFLE